MSGHSKWANIKHKKGAADAKRGKTFTKHAKLIAIAARDGGGDPEMNPGLRAAIANAKADNVPNANIEKAVKRGTGEDKEGANFSELSYEGFGPAGTAFFVEVITDNKNRAVSNVKTIFAKKGGNMGEIGSVGWMFDKKGMILVKIVDGNPEEAELSAIEAGAEDINLEGQFMEIFTAPTELMEVRKRIEDSGLTIERAEIVFVPNTIIKIDSSEDAKKILNLFEALEEDDDVSNVYSNFEINEEILNQLD